MEVRLDCTNGYFVRVMTQTCLLQFGSIASVEFQGKPADAGIRVVIFCGELMAQTTLAPRSEN